MKHLLFSLWLLLWGGMLHAQVYKVKSGGISFVSTAPQEDIRAGSKEVLGALDVVKKSFVIRVNMFSFIGFNSPLQREHFNENYMETSLFPHAIFSGKIIEDIDLKKNGEYRVRTKGKLLIHGVEQDRIIPVIIKVVNGAIQVDAQFVVMLGDHKIRIPRLVNEKLSPEIKVSVHVVLQP